MSSPKILVIPGSARDGSINTRLGKTITAELGQHGAKATQISLSDYEMPLYDGDLETGEGVPANAKKLGSLIVDHDGVVLVCPEFNGSITPLMKNTLDWLSRDLGGVKPYKSATFALAACSPGSLGGIRGINHERDVLVSVGADVISPQLCVGPSGQAFDDDGGLTQERHRNLLQKFCTALIERATIFANR